MLHQTCSVRLATSFNTVQHCPTMLDDVAIIWPGPKENFLSFSLAPCPLPRVPTNGFVLGSRNLQHHSRVQYGCDKGYVLRGSSSSQCTDGDWNFPTPVCEGNDALNI